MLLRSPVLYATMLCAALVLGVPAAAQSVGAYVFRPGHLVMASGDTLRGEIEDRIDLQNARAVRFRAAPAGEPRSFGPEEVAAYAFADGERYVARLVAPEPDGDIQEWGFLRVLVDGPLSLYYFAYHPGEERFYVERADLGLRGLYYTLRPKMRRVAWNARDQRRYVGVLTAAMIPCPEARRDLASLPYTAEAFTRAVSAYNRCVEPGTAGGQAPSERQSDLAFARTLRLGGGASALRWGRGPGSPQSAYREWNSGSAPATVGFLAAAGAEVVMLNVPGRSSFFAEGSLQRKGAQTVVLDARTTRVFNPIYIGITAGFRQVFGTRAVAPYGALALMSGVATGGRRRAFTGVTEFEADPRVYPISFDVRSDAGEVGEVGFFLNRASGDDLSFGLRFERTTLSEDPLHFPFLPKTLEQRSLTLVAGLHL